MPFPLTKGVLYMKVLKLIDDKLEEYLMVVLTVAMTALIFIQVVMRYVFHNSPAWTEELSGTCSSGPSGSEPVTA